MAGKVWTSPRGDVVFTRGGDVFRTDLLYVASMAPGPVAALAFDLPRGTVVTAEGTDLRTYRLDDYGFVGSAYIGMAADFLGILGGLSYAVDSQQGGGFVSVVDLGPPTGASQSPPSGADAD